jgi:hypothetical protein
MTHPAFEVCCDRRLTRLPDKPAPWMVQDRTYWVVLRRRSPFTLPEAVVHDRDTGVVLGIYSWRRAREMFDAGGLPCCG